MKGSLLLLALIVIGCAQTRSGETAAVDAANRPVAKTAGQDESIPLDQVPESVKKAALAAVPGLTLTGAEKEVEGGTTLYSLEGTAGGKACEVEVTVDGKVLEIENEDAEDEDDAEDDDSGDED